LVSSPIEGGGRFLGLLLSFFSPSHGLSLPRSVSLCLSARESKGKNGKEGEERRKKKEESCCGKRNIEDGEFLLLLLFFSEFATTFLWVSGQDRKMRGEFLLLPWKKNREIKSKTEEEEEVGHESEWGCTSFIEASMVRISLSCIWSTVGKVYRW
jgi:hypothetical protein